MRYSPLHGMDDKPPNTNKKPPTSATLSLVIFLFLLHPSHAPMAILSHVVHELCQGWEKNITIKKKKPRRDPNKDQSFRKKRISIYLHVPLLLVFVPELANGPQEG